MRSNNTFLIESELSRHRLLLNGEEIATFATLDGAQAEANKVANRAVPGITLRFELDFKWTLSDLEIRAATLNLESGQPTFKPDIPCRPRVGSERMMVARNRHDRWAGAGLHTRETCGSAMGRGSLCGL